MVTSTGESVKLLDVEPIVIWTENVDRALDQCPANRARIIGGNNEVAAPAR